MDAEQRDLAGAFWESTGERVGELTDLWLKLEASHDEAGPAIKRVLHTMKGEAHMLGFGRCARVVQAMEDVVRSYMDSPVEAAGDAMLMAMDALSVLATGADESAVDLDELSALLEAIGSAAGPEVLSPARAPAPAAERPAPSGELLEAERMRPEGLDPLALSPLVHEARRLHREQALLMPAVREIRRMLRALLAEMDPSLSIDSLTERIVKTLGYGADIERRMADLNAQWSTREFALERALERIEETVRAASMVSVGSLKANVHRTARAAGAALGKRVVVRVTGDAYLDATVERSLGPALLHLVRNAVDHGIEAPSVRVAAGKPEDGRLDVSIHQSDSSVKVVVTDDGGGVDLDALRARLLRHGVEVPHDDAELLPHIFDHGVSTREVATDLSGRGVGLDVVARQVRAIGGSVLVESTRFVGTRFELALPTMLRADVVVPVHIGQVRLALPARVVMGVEHIREIVAGDEGALLRRGGAGEGPLLPLFDMGVLFGAAQQPMPGEPVIIVRHRGGNFAARVTSCDNPRALSFERIEELPFDSEVIRGVAAAPDGGVYFLLDPDALFDALRGRGKVAAPSRDRSASRVRHVLVVEDAPVARELLLGLLRSFGLRVSDAADGRRGLASAREDPPDLILTDIEMPFLGGLEMIAELGRDPALARVPVVVLSTRIDDATRERARALGVRAFLSKQRFVESELRRVIDESLAG